MAILAANCPCCGRDIGFDENAKECTCIFCGAKLITAALVKERLESNNINAGYEMYRKGDDSDNNYWGMKRPADPRMGMPGMGMPSHAPAAPARPAPEERAAEPAAKPVSEPAAKPAEKEKEPEKELTEEEIRIQLMRKAEFKQELREAVKEIDDMRAKRERYASQLKTCNLLMTVGLVFIGLAAAIMVLFDSNGEDKTRFIIAGSLTALGLFTLIISEVRRNSVKKQSKNNEKLITEKKEKRDVLIGRLNKINKHLHIHDDEN